MINQKGATMSLSDIQNMPLEERLRQYEDGELELLSLEELKQSL
jgi:hypothetical protein